MTIESQSQREVPKEALLGLFRKLRESRIEDRYELRNSDLNAMAELCNELNEVQIRDEGRSFSKDDLTVLIDQELKDMHATDPLAHEIFRRQGDLAARKAQEFSRNLAQRKGLAHAEQEQHEETRDSIFSIIGGEFSQKEAA